MSLRKLYEVSRPVMTMKVSAEREVFSNGITNQLLVYWKWDKVITTFPLVSTVETRIRIKCAEPISENGQIMQQKLTCELHCTSEMTFS
jgi:hypothetical protein